MRNTLPLRLHVFVDSGIALTERGTDIVNALQQVISELYFFCGRLCVISLCARITHFSVQRFSAGNMHVTSCPVTRSLHFSRVSVTFRDDGGSVEEIVEEELPQVSGSMSCCRCCFVHSLGYSCHLHVGLLCSPTEVAAEARAANCVTSWVHGPIMQVRGCYAPPHA